MNGFPILLMTLVLTAGLALPATASAGKSVQSFTGHTYFLGHDRDDRHGRHRGRGHDRGRGRGHHRDHRHGPNCGHTGYGSSGPGCREVTQYARLPDGRHVPVRRTLCRDRWGRSYFVPNGDRIIRRDRFRH